MSICAPPAANRTRPAGHKRPFLGPEAERQAKKIAVKIADPYAIQIYTNAEDKPLDIDLGQRRSLIVTTRPHHRCAVGTRINRA